MNANFNLNVQQIDECQPSSVRQYGPHCNNFKIIDNYALFSVLSAPKCCAVRAQLANRLDSIRVGQETMLMAAAAAAAAVLAWSLGSRTHTLTLELLVTLRLLLRVQSAKLLNLSLRLSAPKRCAPNAPQLATIAMIDWPIMSGAQ